MPDVAAPKPSRSTGLRGWLIIGIVGGLASIASLAFMALLVFLLDVFVLAKGPITTEYLTIVERKGLWAESTAGTTGYIYVVRNQSGATSDAHLPWAAAAGDRVRLRQHRSRLLELMLPVEAPVLSPRDTACE
jgi:hypothetical protein